MRRLASLLAVLTLSSLTLSCAGSGGLLGGGSDDDEDGSPPRGRGESAVVVSYGRTAKDNWARGERAYADEDYLAAQKYYRYIRTKFPYSAFAVRSELRIADCMFEREHYLEAVDSFQNFIRLHPTHHGVSYAMLMTGKAYYEQIPTDWFFMPPSYEKDQSAVRDAEQALRAFVERFAEDERVEEGKKLLTEVRTRLVEHERYVADFYDGADKPRAQVGRLEVIRTKFADVALDDDLLLEIAEVYAQLGERDQVQGAVDELAAKFPQSDNLEDARELLASLPEPVEAAPAPATP